MRKSCAVCWALICKRGGTMPAMLDTLKNWLQRALHLLNPFKFLYDALRLWLDADGLRMSAAMSFYGMLSLAPLLLLLPPLEIMRDIC